MKVEITIDGEEIPLNAFAQSVIGGSIIGAISPLRGVEPDWKNAKISIDR
ncbi:MAG: hypothetical protein SVM80_05780 [Halobacteriota archaeon]|nr:hypothetical protein [Halobacteriota archaeon]